MNVEPKAWAQGESRLGACKQQASDFTHLLRSHEAFHSLSTSRFGASLKSCVIPVTQKDHPSHSLFPASITNNSKQDSTKMKFQHLQHLFGVLKHVKNVSKVLPM